MPDDTEECEAGSGIGEPRTIAERRGGRSETGNSEVCSVEQGVEMIDKGFLLYVFVVMGGVSLAMLSLVLTFSLMHLVFAILISPFILGTWMVIIMSLADWIENHVAF